MSGAMSYCHHAGADSAEAVYHSQPDHGVIPQAQASFCSFMTCQTSAEHVVGRVRLPQGLPLQAHAKTAWP